MKWNQFRLKTTTQAEDIVSSMLMDLGIQGVQIEDKVPLTKEDKEQMFVDILPDIPADDGTAYLTFYLDEEEDKGTILLNIRKELDKMRAYLDVGACVIEESQTEDVDWVNNWKQYFHQFYIDDILVIPSWEKVEEKANRNLNRFTCIHSLSSSHQTVGRIHCNTAHCIIPDLLGNLRCEPGAFMINFDGIKKCRQLVMTKPDIQYRSDYLHHLANVFFAHLAVSL